MEYVIIESGGKQYKVSKGSIIDVDKINLPAGTAYKFDKVLLYKSDDICEIGKPILTEITVTGKIIDQRKGVKVRVAKFKAKARYRKVTGFRQHLTRIEITEISVKKTAVKKEKQTKEITEDKVKKTVENKS